MQRKSLLERERLAHEQRGRGRQDRAGERLQRKMEGEKKTEEEQRLPAAPGAKKEDDEYIGEAQEVPDSRAISGIARWISK
jgi:hypothetical protein